MLAAQSEFPVRHKKKRLGIQINMVQKCRKQNQMPTLEFICRLSLDTFVVAVEPRLFHS